MEGPKQVLSIKVSPSLYQRLKKEIGTGKVSRFIEKTVSEKLDEQAGKATQEQKEFEEFKKWKESRKASDSPVLAVCFKYSGL